MNDTMTENHRTESSRDRIANYIRGKIHSKEFAPGDKLPTTRELAQAASVSGHTVRLAMSRLEDEGLVYSARGSGTFVCEEAVIENGDDTNLKSVAIMGVLSDDQELPDRYRYETSAGYMEQLEADGLIAQLFPNYYRKLPAAQLTKTMIKMGCCGVIWSGPTEAERKKIEEIIAARMPVVITYRADVTDWLPMVAADFVYGGYKAGCYLKSKGCRRVFAIGYDICSNHHPNTMQSGLPNGLINGLSEGLGLDILDNENISRDIISGYEKSSSEMIFHILNNLEPEMGVVFSNSYHFRNFLRDFGSVAKQILASIPFVIIGNTTIIRKISPFAQEMNFPVIGDPFEEIARVAVQKLVNIAGGKLENTKTLLKPYFEMFWDIEAAKGND
ncbi:MAG: GntR family transcriptional regulator [Sedimentisphaeraceae bacterium JB056]